MNQAGLAECIVRAVNSYHPHLHLVIYESIILTGGSTLFPRFAQTLQILKVNRSEPDPPGIPPSTIHAEPWWRTGYHPISTVAETGAINSSSQGCPSGGSKSNNGQLSNGGPNKEGEFTDVVGSPYYVAPKVLMKRYGPETDVWSAGIILYILLSGVPPFWAEAEQEIFDEVLHGEFNFSADPWPSISESAKDLVRRMLIKNPKKRLTAHEVLCHPWVQVDGLAPDKPLDSAVLSRLKQFSAMDKLKKMALRVIAESLSEEKIAGLKEMFKMIDTDNSGQITFEELKAGLKKIWRKPQ